MQTEVVIAVGERQPVGKRRAGPDLRFLVGAIHVGRSRERDAAEVDRVGDAVPAAVSVDSIIDAKPVIDGQSADIHQRDRRLLDQA